MRTGFITHDSYCRMTGTVLLDLNNCLLTTVDLLLRRRILTGLWDNSPPPRQPWYQWFVWPGGEISQLLKKHYHHIRSMPILPYHGCRKISVFQQVSFLEFLVTWSSDILLLTRQEKKVRYVSLQGGLKWWSNATMLRVVLCDMELLGDLYVRSESYRLYCYWKLGQFLCSLWITVVLL